MTLKALLHKIHNRCIRLRYQPIRVYCLHHACLQFDAEWMNESDWMPIEDFKNKVLALKQDGVTFLALTDAYQHICSDNFRFKKYAVLTFDDGYATLKEILPWLKEQNIPTTLFVNPDYAAGKAYRDTPKERYLTIDESAKLNVEIGMHGLQHVDVSKIGEKEFSEFADGSIQTTSQISGYIPFWAYTWGRHNSMTDDVLKSRKIVPVLMDGMKNYNDASCIHRELLE